MHYVLIWFMVQSKAGVINLSASITREPLVPIFTLE